MSTPRLVSLLGLGFGDCGKGMFTDALCRRWPVHTVVRFNGGAQDGHNVMLPDRRQHTFSQFSSGSFVPGVATVLAYPVLVHPSALLVEHTHLQRIVDGDVLERLLIDSRCRINTPFHQAAGRLRELQRGVKSHGTCGVGVGETVRHSLHYPDHVLCYGDLGPPWPCKNLNSSDGVCLLNSPKRPKDGEHLRSESPNIDCSAMPGRRRVG